MAQMMTFGYDRKTPATKRCGINVRLNPAFVVHVEGHVAERTGGVQKSKTLSRKLRIMMIKLVDVGLGHPISTSDISLAADTFNILYRCTVTHRSALRDSHYIPVSHGLTFDAARLPAL